MLLAERFGKLQRVMKRSTLATATALIAADLERQIVAQRAACCLAVVGGVMIQREQTRDDARDVFSAAPLTLGDVLDARPHFSWRACSFE